MSPRFRTPSDALALLCSLTIGGVPGGEAPARGAGAGPRFVVDDGACGITHRNLSGPTAAEGKAWLLDCIGQGIAVLDANGDGRADLYFPQGRSHTAPDGGDCANRLYLNLGGRRFVEAGAEAGVAHRGYGFGALAFDHDNDGDSDLLVTNLGPNVLYRNDGGRFTDVTAQHAGLAGGDGDWSTGAAAGDVDGDGDLDLYVCNYLRHDGAALDERGLCRFMTECRVPCGPLGLDPQPDVFFRNGGPPDFRFTEATADAGLAHAASYGFQPVFTDVDGDADLDLYVSNDSQPNLLFVNDGKGRFTENGMVAGVACSNAGQAEAGMGVACGDLQGDGLPELYVTNFSTQMNSLYVNRTRAGGAPWFDEQSRPAGTGGPTFFKLSWGCAIADFDDDGAPDIFSSNSHVYPQVDDCPPEEITYRQTNSLFRRVTGPRLRFEECDAGALTGVPGTHRCSVVADLDDDGRLDLVVNRLDERPLIAWNDTQGAGHWLALRVELAAGRLAVGARVTARAGEQRWSAEVRCGSSFLSTEDPRVHFGLGAAAVLDELVVRFPGGAELHLQDLAADRCLLVRAGDPPVVTELRTDGSTPDAEARDESPGGEQGPP
jgi:enediyne biosynthesis protein E4